MNITLEYEEMVSLTITFYEKLNIFIPEEYVKRAVTSLTMPDFAYCYNIVYSLFYFLGQKIFL